MAALVLLSKCWMARLPERRTRAKSFVEFLVDCDVERNEHKDFSKRQKGSREPSVQVLGVEDVFPVGKMAL